MHAIVHFTLVKRTYVAHAGALKQTFIFGKKKGSFSAKGLSECNMRKYMNKPDLFLGGSGFFYSKLFQSSPKGD